MPTLLKFDEAQLRVMLARYKAGASLIALGLEFRCCPTTISKGWHRLGIYFRKQKNYNPGTFVPTPQEIREATTKIQNGWTVTEEKARAGIPLDKCYEFPKTSLGTYRMNGKEQVIQGES